MSIGETGGHQLHYNRFAYVPLVETEKWRWSGAYSCRSLFEPRWQAVDGLALALLPRHHILLINA